MKHFLTDISGTVNLREKLKSLNHNYFSIFGLDGSSPNSACAFLGPFFADISTSNVEEIRPTLEFLAKKWPKFTF